MTKIMIELRKIGDELLKIKQDIIWTPKAILSMTEKLTLLSENIDKQENRQPTDQVANTIEFIL